MEPPSAASSENGGNFLQVETPDASSRQSLSHVVTLEEHDDICPRRILYTSILIALLHPLYYGSSTTQLNLKAFHDSDECSMRPVAAGTCLMFPGHSTLQWTIVMNSWVIGGMVGGLASGSISDRLGRKRTMRYNSGFIVIGAVVEMCASNLWTFIVGRVFSGVSSGCATGVVSEVSPPHLRNRLGIGFQIAMGVGMWLVGATFFVADTSSGWRYIAGFPLVFAGLYLGFAHVAMVESLAWLLLKG